MILSTLVVLDAICGNRSNPTSLPDNVELLLHLLLLLLLLLLALFLLLDLLAFPHVQQDRLAANSSRIRVLIDPVPHWNSKECAALPDEESGG